MVNAVGYGASAYYGMMRYAGANSVNALSQANVANVVKTPSGDMVSDDSMQAKALKRSGAVECETCNNRKYQDGSNESDVSFKSPGHISPESSGAVVRAHEQQHVSNAYQKEAKGHDVVSASVTLKNSICPECGRSYTAGGETRTVIKYNEDNPYGRNAKSFDAAAGLVGANFDIAV